MDEGLARAVAQAFCKARFPYEHDKDGSHLEYDTRSVTRELMEGDSWHSGKIAIIKATLTYAREHPEVLNAD